MGSIVKNLVVRAGADFSSITKEARKASKGMKSMHSSIAGSCSRIESVVSGVKKTFGALGAALSMTAIIGAAKDAKDAYEAQAESEARLAQVMRNTMGASAAEIQSIKDLTDAQQALGVVGADVQLAGAQELATYLTLSSSLKKLIPAMNDMAVQQYGYNVTAEQTTNIATMLGKVMEGQVGGLSRYGYYFDSAQEAILKYGTEAQKAAVLVEVVESSVGGMNAALASTPLGRMHQLSNTLGDIKERFGQAVTTVSTAFLPMLYRVASALSAIANFANRVAQALANVFGGQFKKSASTIAAGAGGAAAAIDDMGDAAAGAGGKAAKAAQQVLSFDKLNRLSEPSGSGSGGGDAGADAGGGAGIGGYDDEAEEAAESSTKLERILIRVKGLIGSLDFGPAKESLQGLKNSLGALGETIGSGLSWAFDHILTPLAHWTVEQAAPAGLDLLRASVDLLKASLEAIQPAITWAWDNFLLPIASWTGQAFIDTLQWITEKIQGLTDLVSGNMSFREWLDTLSPLEIILGSVATAIAAVTTAAKSVHTVLTAVSAVTSGLNAVFALLTSPIGLVVIAVAALTAAGIALYKNWDSVCAAMKQILDAIATAVKTAFAIMLATVSAKVLALKSVIESVFYGIAAICRGAINLILGGIESWINGWIASINLLLAGVGKVASLFGGSVTGQIAFVSLPRFATGGFPEDGLFLANHNELVGKFSDGSTAVANNEQIIEGIKRGVSEAITEAIRNGEFVAKAYLDGRDVTDYASMRAQSRLRAQGG